RFSRDWSSDVCSSDLVVADAPGLVMARFQLGQLLLIRGAVEETRDLLEPITSLPPDIALGAYARGLLALGEGDTTTAIAELEARSEERRVGKECRVRR